MHTIYAQQNTLTKATLCHSEFYIFYNNNNNDLYSLREKCSYKAHTINDIIWYKYIMTNSNVIAHESP